jgi:hypothetical protein
MLQLRTPTKLTASQGDTQKKKGDSSKYERTESRETKDQCSKLDSAAGRIWGSVVRVLLVHNVVQILPKAK